MESAKDTPGRTGEASSRNSRPLGFLILERQNSDPVLSWLGPRIWRDVGNLWDTNTQSSQIQEEKGLSEIAQGNHGWPNPLSLTHIKQYGANLRISA